MKKDYNDLHKEYDLSQLPVMPKGRYAPGRRMSNNLVVLEPDIAQAFPSDGAVNTALRLVLQMVEIPQRQGHKYLRVKLPDDLSGW